MSQLEMENLLHYEHNLAACYEAEYLLELSMQRELIGNSPPSDWPGYTDASETRTMTPSLSLGQPHGVGVKEATERMDVAANSHHPLQLPNHTSHSFHSPCIHPVSSPASVLQSSVSPHTASAIPHHINGMVAPHYSNGSMQRECSNGQELSPLPPSLPEFQFQNGVISSSSARSYLNSSHSDGPQRKRMCLQRPEM